MLQLPPNGNVVAIVPSLVSLLLKYGALGQANLVAVTTSAVGIADKKDHLRQQHCSFLAFEGM